MSVTGIKLNSLRLSGLENRRLALALALSLAVHVLTWGGYAVGERFGWWQSVHWPTWLHRLTQKVIPVPVPVANDEPPIFVEVSQPSAEAPKKAQYFSTRNSKAANPDATRETDQPKLTGKQTDVPKTETVRKPDFSQTPPAPHSQSADNQQQASQQELAMNSGELTLGKPQESMQQQQQEQPQPRPRTLRQARAQLAHQLPGLQMQQDGGVPNHAIMPSLDVKVTGFADYDARFVSAVSQHWYDLLDSQQFALDRTGKVTLRFHLNYDGTISNMSFEQNTVGDLLGYVCQKAVTDAAPFERFPSDMRLKLGDYCDVQFTFYYTDY
jgi:hypothetical protein